MNSKFFRSSGLLALIFGVGVASTLVTAAHAVGSGTSSSSTATTSTNSVSQDMRTANARIAAGNYASAIRLLQAVVKQDSGNANAFNLLGFSSRKLKKYDDAEIFYARALTISASHLGALEYQGELFLILNQPEKARANLDLLLNTCGASCDEYLDLKDDIAEFDAKISQQSNTGKFIKAPSG